MRIAYVTKNDPSDVHEWSGSTYYMNQALKEAGVQTLSIGNLQEGSHYLWNGVKKEFYKRVLAKTYQKERNPVFLRYLSRQVEGALQASGVDAVLSPGTLPLAYLKTDRPIAFWTDATFAGLVDYYPGFMDLCAETIRDGNAAEQAALSKCRLAIFSSDWAARTALESYDVDPSKVKVVPFGANIECDRDLAGIERIVSERTFEFCKLLFAGVDWRRKGGDVAVRVAEMLNQRGLRTELHLVGCRPPGPTPDFVKVHGFISKKTEQGRGFLDGLFKNSHFFILPTRAECCAVVFAEASSFGLPTVAADVGGVSTAVRTGLNGMAISPGDDPAKYCDFIMEQWSARDRYRDLCLTSFREYSERLNWKASGVKVQALLEEFCGPRGSRGSTP
jgi:glycosyltransferase involved in cell wall biosynthesis